MEDGEAIENTQEPPDTFEWARFEEEIGRNVTKSTFGRKPTPSTNYATGLVESTLL
jgi:hypothetical protein